MEHTNELREVMENIKLSGAIDAKDQFEIDNILKNIEDAVQAGVVKNKQLQKQIDAIYAETDRDADVQEHGELEPMTLEDERKLLIARRLMHNLTEDELTKLETFAKSQFKKPGIIYKDVY